MIMSQIGIVVGPAQRGTYYEAVGKAYRRGNEHTDHTATLFVTSQMILNPILDVGFKEVQPLKSNPQAVHKATIKADHFLFNFPL